MNLPKGSHVMLNHWVMSIMGQASNNLVSICYHQYIKEETYRNMTTK